MRHVAAKCTHLVDMTNCNRQYDPWREETISSDFRPGGPAVSKSGNPIFVMPAASHCYDLIWRNGDGNSGVRDTQNKEVQQMKAWISEWTGPGHH